MNRFLKTNKQVLFKKYYDLLPHSFIKNYLLCQGVTNKKIIESIKSCKQLKILFLLHCNKYSLKQVKM